MFDRFVQNFYENPKKRRQYITGAAVLALALLLIAFWPKANSKDYNLTNLAPTSNGINYSLDNEYIYSYNGLSFTRSNLNTGEYDVLASPGRIPRASRVSWVGNKGAVMQFENSFYSTRIEEVLNQLNLEISAETKKFIWYYDFELDIFKIISTNSLLVDNIVLKGDGSGFYFLLRGESRPEYEDDDIGPTLKEYGFESGEMSTVADDLPFIAVESMNACSLGIGVCMIGLGDEQVSNANFGIYYIDEDGSASLTIEAEGTLKFSGLKDWYVIGGVVSNSDGGEEEALEGALETFGGYLVDIKDLGNMIDLKVAISDSIDASLSPDGQLMLALYSFGNSQPTDNSTLDYYSAEIDLVKHSLKVGQSKNLSTDEVGGRVYRSFGAGYNGSLLLESIDGSAWLLSAASPSSATIKVSEFSNLLIESKKCGAGIKAEIDESKEGNFVRVLVPTSENYRVDFKSFAECMADSGAGFGHEFYFGLTDGFGGKVLTD